MPRKGVAKTSNAEKFKKVKQYADKLQTKNDDVTAKIKELFEAGPPAYIREQIKALQAKAARTKRSAEQTARDLGLHVPHAPAA